jgi:Fe-Mn family superoxide dismutase
MPIFGTPPSSGEPTQSQSQNETSASPRTSEVGPGPLSSSRYPPSRARSIARPAPGAGLPAPLAVLNLFECAYLGEKYGVWGRREYARDWWRTLDWNKVQKRSSQIL